jgi:hypothetical protein
MLIEIWEKIRGYDKWIETEATIVSGEKVRRAMRLRGAQSSDVSADLLMWKDQFSRRQYGPFVTYDTSPLYQLLDGETILIRFDPAKPDRYYNRPLFVGWLLHLSKAAIAVAVGGGFIVWRIWMIVSRRG